MFTAETSRTHSLRTEPTAVITLSLSRIVAAPLIVGAILVAGAGIGNAATGGSATPSGDETYSYDDTRHDCPDSEGDEGANDTSDGTTEFGDTFTYPDGLSITFSGPQEFDLSEFAVADTGYAHHVVFDITVDNGTDTQFNPRVFITEGFSGDREASQFFDFPGGIGAAPDVNIPSGSSLTWQIGFDIEDLDDITLTASPDFERDATSFSSPQPKK